MFLTSKRLARLLFVVYIINFLSRIYKIKRRIGSERNIGEDTG